MNIASGIAIYFVCWWVTFLTVLPLGVRPQSEEGEVAPGTVASAPVKPHMGRKIILTSILAFLPWGLVFAIVQYEILSFSDFPFIPEFSND